MRQSGLSRCFRWSLVLLIGGLLTVACGNAPGQTPDSTTIQSEDSSQSQSTQPTTPGSSNITGISSFNPCDSFGLLGPMASGFAAQTAGGNIETSATPQSELAEKVGDFAVDSLQDALEGDVSADCYMEFSSDDETGVWVALTLPDTFSSGAANLVSDAMAERGASVTGTMSSGSQGATFDLVAFDSLPFDAPAGAPVDAPAGSDLMGALYFVASTDGAYLAVMLASSGDSGGDATSESGSDSSGDSASSDAAVSNEGEANTPGTTEPPVAVAPSGLADTVNDILEPALEDALGIDLVVTSFFQTGSAGDNAITLSYAFGESLPSLEEGAAALTGVIEELGGNVTFNMSAAEGSTVLFEQVEIGEFTLSGTLSLSVDTVVALVTFEG